MASKKVTVTLDESQLERIRALVAAGTAPSVSGFVQHAVGVALDDVAGWGALLAEALRETGGALTERERSWADEVLGVSRPEAGSAALCEPRPYAGGDSRRRRLDRPRPQ